MAQVSWTAEAEGWLHEIHEHIPSTDQVLIGVFHDTMDLERYLR